jgi:hypothetical protein
MKASITDDNDDQAAAEDGQTSDDDGEEASRNAIKVTHDTPLGSNGDGADQLIKTFGILRRRHSARFFAPPPRIARSRWRLPCCAELFHGIKPMLQSGSQKYSDSRWTQSPHYRARSDPMERRIAIVTDAGGTLVAPRTTAPRRTAKPCTCRRRASPFSLLEMTRSHRAARGQGWSRLSFPTRYHAACHTRPSAPLAS